MAIVKEKPGQENFTLCKDFSKLMEKYRGTLFGDYLYESLRGYSSFQKKDSLILNGSIKFDSENKKFSIVKDKKEELVNILDNYLKFEKEKLLPFLNKLGVNKNIFKKYKNALYSEFLNESGDLTDEAKFVLRLHISIRPNMDSYLDYIIPPNQNEVLESVHRIVKSYKNPFPKFEELTNSKKYSEAANLLENTTTFLDLRSRELIEHFGLSGDDFEKYLNGKYSGENKDFYDFLKSFVSYRITYEGGREAYIDPDRRISNSFENFSKNIGNKFFKIKEISSNSITSSGNQDFINLFEPSNTITLSQISSNSSIANEFFIFSLTNNGGMSGTNLLFNELSKYVSVYENKQGLRFIEINDVRGFRETINNFHSNPKSFKYITLDQVVVGILDSNNINYKEFELFLNGSFNTLPPDKIKLYDNLSKLIVVEYGNASIYGFSESTLEWYDSDDFNSLISEWEEKYQKEFPGIDLSNANLFIYFVERYNKDKLDITAKKNI